MVLAAAHACKNESSGENRTVLNDSLANVKAIISRDSLLFHSNNLAAWIASDLQKTNIDWNSLRLEEYAVEEKHPQEPFTPPANFFRDYEEVLKWSADSSHILDIGSYGSVLVKDKKGNPKVEAAEADTEISLIDIANKQKRRLFFVGPSSVIINGTWADTSDVLILGSFDEHANNKPDTLFWLINVKENFYRMYKWKR